jgi:hypothetical protein
MDDVLLFDVIRGIGFGVLWLGSVGRYRGGAPVLEAAAGVAALALFFFGLSRLVL